MPMQRNCHNILHCVGLRGVGYKLVTRYISFLGLLLSLSLSSVCAAADLPRLAHRFVIIAHRGDHEHTHENTIEAFENAIRAGIDFVEMDLRRTKDGRYVIMHDSTVDRTTDGHGRVEDLTLKEIEGLKVIDRNRPELPPTHVPTFEEVLKTCRGRINIYLDFKKGDPEVVAPMIREAGMAQNVIVYDGVGAVKRWRKAAPEFPMIVSPPEKSAATSGSLVRFVDSTKVEILDGDWSDYSKESVLAAVKAGARVWPDIQSSKEAPEYWEKVVDVGFDGVQSDKPELLSAWLAAKGLR